MANSPSGWQYPQPPGYPQGPMAPGSVALPPRPAALRRAVSLMYAGAAVAIATGIVDGLTTHNVTFYVYKSTSPNTATVHDASSLVSGLISGIIAAGLWLWMAWKTGAGRNWARVLSTVFFGFACLQLIGGIAGAAGPDHTVLAFVFLLAEWAVGLTALIAVWKRESSDFFAFAKQARLARAYGTAYPGYQPPGYGPPPQYGPPQYGPPDNDRPAQ
jgi:hypothetical protein